MSRDKKHTYSARYDWLENEIAPQKEGKKCKIVYCSIIQFFLSIETY